MKARASVWDAIESGDMAESLRARARVMAGVQKAVRNWGLSQAAAAGKLGISQPRINDLLRGKIERFSLDALFDLATRAGVEPYSVLAVREAPATYGRRPGARRKLGVREAAGRARHTARGCPATVFAQPREFPRSLQGVSRRVGVVREFRGAPSTPGGWAMSGKTPRSKTKRTLRFPAAAAMRRAAARARKVARLHGTPIYFIRDGKIVAEKP